MANPIKETPILYGKDARRFAERIANPKKISPEENAEKERVYQLCLQARERGRLQEEAEKTA
jgi:hypothetical protein